MPRLARRHPELKLTLLEARSLILSDKTEYSGAYRYDRQAWELARTASGIPEDLRARLEFDLAEDQSRIGQLKRSEATLHDLIGRQTRRLGAARQQSLFSTVLLAKTLAFEHRHGGIRIDSGRRRREASRAREPSLPTPGVSTLDPLPGTAPRAG